MNLVLPFFYICLQIQVTTNVFDYLVKDEAFIFGFYSIHSTKGNTL